ncbi:unnamed protein product [Calypogeia fissa]
MADEGSTLDDASSKPGTRDWVVKIKGSIRQHSLMRENTVKRNPRKTTRRVVRDVRELNTKVYCASEFSFGLIDRSPLDLLKRRADRCKVAMATALLKDLDKTEDYWEELCSKAVPDPEEIQEYYDEHERNAFSLLELQSVLTLDAVFLAILEVGNPISLLTSHLLNLHLRG